MRAKDFVTGATVLLAAPALAMLAATTVERATLPASALEDVPDTAAGAALFGERCGGCHAVEPGASARFGPNLANIGRDAATRRPDMDAVDYLYQSIEQPDAWRAPGGDGYMPRGLLDGVPVARVRNLLTYLTSLGATADPTAVTALDIDLERLAVETPIFASVDMLKKGEALFFETLGCSACHALDEEPGADLLAPSLSHAGTLSADYLAQSVRAPSEVIAAGYRSVSVTMLDGMRIDGILHSEDVSSANVLVFLPTGSAALRMIPRENIADLTASHVSPMPPYALDADNEAALIAFLKSLDGMTGGT